TKSEIRKFFHETSRSLRPALFSPGVPLLHRGVYLDLVYLRRQRQYLDVSGPARVPDPDPEILSRAGPPDPRHSPLGRPATGVALQPRPDVALERDRFHAHCG